MSSSGAQKILRVRCENRPLIAKVEIYKAIQKLTFPDDASLINDADFSRATCTFPSLREMSTDNANVILKATEYIALHSVKRAPPLMA